MKKLLALALAATMVITILPSCAKQSASANKITAVVGSEPQSLDPAINQTADGATYIVHAFEGLMKVNKDLQYVPGMASSRTTSADGLTVTYKIRSDAKWSDGVAVKAGDFVYAWQRDVNPVTASAYAYQLYYIQNATEINSQYVGTDGKPAKVKVGTDGKPAKFKYDDKTKTFSKDASGNYVPDSNGQYVPDANGKYVAAKADGTPIWLDDLGAKATDDSTLVVTLAAPCPYFDQIVAFPTLFPVRKDIVEKNPSDWASNPSTYVTNGPYKLTSWVHKSKLVFTKNDKYYDAKDIVSPELDFMLMSDNNAAYSAFKNKTIDVNQNIFPTDEIPKLVKSGDCKIYPSNGNFYVSLNVKVKPFDNVNVRKALNLAIDRQYVVDKITKGGQVPAGAFVPLGMNDVAKGSDFRKVGGNYYDPSASAVKSNIAQAKQLLATAGYPDGKGFPTIEIKYNPGGANQTVMEYIANQWKVNLGINYKIISEDFATLVVDRNTGNYQVARDAWVGDYNDPMTFLDLATTDSGNNDSHYSNPNYDKYVAQAKTTNDTATRMKLMHEAEKTLMDDMPVIPIFFRTDPLLLSSKVTGVVDSPLGYIYLMWASKK